MYVDKYVEQRAKRDNVSYAHAEKLLDGESKYNSMQLRDKLNQQYTFILKHYPHELVEHSETTTAWSCIACLFIFPLFVCYLLCYASQSKIKDTSGNVFNQTIGHWSAQFVVSEFYETEKTEPCALGCFEGGCTATFKRKNGKKLSAGYK